MISPAFRTLAIVSMIRPCIAGRSLAYFASRASKPIMLSKRFSGFLSFLAVFQNMSKGWRTVAPPRSTVFGPPLPVMSKIWTDASPSGMDFLRNSCSSSGYIPLTGTQMTWSPDLTVFEIIGERKLISEGEETSSPTSKRMWLPLLRPPPRIESRLLIPVEECDAEFLMTG